MKKLKKISNNRKNKINKIIIIYAVLLIRNVYFINLIELHKNKFLITFTLYIFHIYIHISMK